MHKVETLKGLKWKEKLHLGYELKSLNASINLLQLVRYYYNHYDFYFRLISTATVETYEHIVF